MLIKLSEEDMNRIKDYAKVENLPCTTEEEIGFALELMIGFAWNHS